MKIETSSISQIIEWNLDDYYTLTRLMKLKIALDL